MGNRESVRGTVQIERPPSEVFAYIADFRHDPAWRREVLSVKYTTPEPVAAAGSQCVEIARAAGRKRESWQEVLRCEKDASIACATFKAIHRQVSERTVRRADGGSELEIRIRYRTGQAWRDRMLGPIRRWLAQRRLNRNLLKLKQLLEDRPIDGIVADGGRG